MKNVSAISRINILLEQISIQATAIDNANATLKSHKSLQDNSLFSNTLFSTSSDKFSHYVQETKRKTAELSRLLATDNNDLTTSLLEQIEQQIASLTIALKANTTLHYDGQYRLDKRKAYFKAQTLEKRTKKMVKAVVQPSQSLYQKLAEHHEFERRLATMIAEREFERSKCGDKKAQLLTQEILKLHQRLGRCRHAISVIENDIVRAEKRL